MLNKNGVISFDNSWCIRLFNDRKKEMLVISDRTEKQTAHFIVSMIDSDQDYEITFRNDLGQIETFTKKESELLLKNAEKEGK